MPDAVVLDRPAPARDQEVEPEILDTEAAEVAQLLARAGVDHASSLWFQLLELATEQACDWTERSADSCAPLSPRAAAVLGLRTLAANLLLTAAEQDEAARAAAEACLSVCAEAQGQIARPPARRRWGEGAVPQPPERRSLLNRAVGCC
jgi:hypothetical protein